MEAVRALGLALLVVACAAPVGLAALRGCGLGAPDFAGRFELLATALTLGLGVLAQVLTLLGLAGLFSPPLVLLLPPACALAAARPARAAWQCTRRGRSHPHHPSRLASSPAPPRSGAGAGDGWGPACVQGPGSVPGQPGGRWQPWSRRALAVALTVLAGEVLIQDLAPPTDYDGLLYHLVAPRAFLAAHRLAYIPDNFSANLPMLGEMLYAVGLAGGSDRMPQLLHGAAGALAVGLTYAFGARCFGRRAALLGAAGLAATPLLPFLSTRAYIDLWTLDFGLLATFGVVFWRRTRQRGWLLLAGASAGLALETKYAAAPLVAVLAAALALDALRERRLTRLSASLIFGAATAVTALPWYVRQVLLLGNPVWPMYFGGREWDAGRVEQLTYFVSQYGAGHGLRDWLLVPWQVFAESWRFGHVPDSFPPLLALAVPLAVLVPGRPARWLLGVTAAFTLLWLRGWQDLRFLLSVYPLLALLGAAGLVAASRRRPRAAAALAPAAAALVAVTAAYELPKSVAAAGVAFGRESDAAYLQRQLPDQRAVDLINDTARGAVLFLGDGQIWYCSVRCIPDAAHDNLLVWVIRPGTPAAALERLRAAGVSHILLSKRDYWYLDHQDPQGRLKRQLAEFYVLKAQYLDLAYADALTEVYRLREPARSGS